MAPHTQSKTLQNDQSIHPLFRMRSEGHLKAIQEPPLPRLCSMGQLSSPPDWSLPPIPLRSPLRLSSQTHGINGPTFSGNRIVEKHSRFSASDSDSSFSSHNSQGEEAEAGRHFERNTMLVQEQMRQKKIAFTLRQHSKKTPNLEDLSGILHLRGRLQEVGTTFTAQGEMQTYGNPPLNSDLEQMLRLGAMYDEQWNLFFTRHETNQDKHALWPDLKVLKKMLQNEGVLFDEQHERLNYGSSHPKLIRLSDQYDVVREEWLRKTMPNLHHLQRPSPKVSNPPTNLGWKFLLDDSNDEETARTNRRRSSCLTVVVEEPQPGNGPGVRVQEGQLREDDTATAESSNAAPNTTNHPPPSSPHLGQEKGRGEQVGVWARLVEDERRRTEERQRGGMSWVGTEKKKKYKGGWKWLQTVLGRRKGVSTSTGH